MDDWMEAALTDDAVIVELLLRLKQSSSSVLMLSKAPPSQLMGLPLLGWGHRRPRSKPFMIRKDRCSPTTPLSWSGGGAASPSDGYEESSHTFGRTSVSRSKAAFMNETNITSANKRSKRKKTFAELKEEESLLLKEKIHLKRELASLRETLKEQKARSENLKRIKVDLHLQSGNNTSPIPGERRLTDFSQEVSNIHHSVSTLLRHYTNDDLASSNSCTVQKDAETLGRCFIVPDLNIAPSEEEYGPEISCGMKLR